MTFKNCEDILNDKKGYSSEEEKLAFYNLCMSSNAAKEAVSKLWDEVQDIPSEVGQSVLQMIKGFLQRII